MTKKKKDNIKSTKVVKKTSPLTKTKDSVIPVDIQTESTKNKTVTSTEDGIIFTDTHKYFKEIEPTINAVIVQVINTSTNALPKYKTGGAVGMDVRSAIGMTILPKVTRMVPTGIYMAVPEGYEMQVRARSGLAKNGIQLANGVGTIDEDYRGECNVLLHNSSNAPFKILKGDRIAQFVLNEIPKVIWNSVDELPSSERGTGGFGITGKE